MSTSETLHDAGLSLVIGGLILGATRSLGTLYRPALVVGAGAALLYCTRRSGGGLFRYEEIAYSPAGAEEIIEGEVVEVGA